MEVAAHAELRYPQRYGTHAGHELSLNWLFGIVCGRARETSGGELSVARRVLLVAAVAFNLAVIGFFKYEGFVAANVNALLGTPVVPDLDLPLPIGISFYTLQALSYVIDVHRGDVEAQKNPLYLGMYVACFPQLIAGPIVRYSTIREQIVGRKETLERFASGIRLFCVGLAKKGASCQHGSDSVRQNALDGRTPDWCGRSLGGASRLHVSNLLRLLGLFRHGHRPWTNDGLRISAQL